MDFNHQQILNLVEHLHKADWDDYSLDVQPGRKISMSYDHKIFISKDE